MKSLRIAQVAPPYEAVPPHRYGGTERVVSYLTEALVARGHDVTLFATGDSRTNARLVPIAEHPLRENCTLEELKSLSVPAMLDVVATVLSHADDFDIIHWHIDFFPWAFTSSINTPSVTTMHGRLDLPFLATVFNQHPDTAVVSISDHQRTPLAHIQPNWVGTVYNAVPVTDFPFKSTPGDYFLFLGRINTDKRPDWAVEIAKQTGIPLKVAAKVDPYDQDYYETEIKPLFDHPLVEFVGEANEEEKRELLVNARALLFPIDWPEPFGMVQIEAMACGTPVLAMRRGAVPEVVEHGVTGLIGDSLEELIALAPQLVHLDRRVVRQMVEHRFSAETMARGYEAIYRRMIAEKVQPFVSPLQLAS
jgi:glycosyltransferase involved in cell wall biosynthesis